MNSRMLTIETHGDDERGYLSFFESNKSIPFDIKRIYYVYGVPLNYERGFHAHKKLQQVLWCPAGTIEVVLDDGVSKQTYLLDSPQKGLLVGDGIWRETYWKKEGAVLCVAASEFYDEEDYISDYNEFLKYVEGGYWNDENKL